MKNLFKKILIIILFSLFSNTISYSDNTYFIDLSKLLNQSKAGSEVQSKLKKKLELENTKIRKEEENIKKQEQELISQKKILSNEEYKSKLNNLRKKVSELQKYQQDTLVNIAKQRDDAKKKLLDSINPIMKKYMEDNSIRIIVDKQSVILGDTALEITDKIIEILNQKLNSIKID